MLMSTHPSRLFHETIFQQGCQPLKFLHAIEIHQGLLAHSTNGDGMGLPPTKL